MIVMSSSDLAGLVIRHAGFLFVSLLGGEQGWVRGGWERGKMLEEQSFEGVCLIRPVRALYGR